MSLVVGYMASISLLLALLSKVFLKVTKIIQQFFYLRFDWILQASWQNVFVIYVDIKEAFPTVRRGIIFKVLEQQGTPDNVIRISLRSIVLWAVLRMSIMFRNSFLYSSGVDYVSQFTSVFVLHLSIDSVQFHSSISRKRTSKHRLGTNAHLQCFGSPLKFARTISLSAQPDYAKTNDIAKRRSSIFGVHFRVATSYG